MAEGRAEEEVPGAPVTESDEWKKARVQHLLAAAGLAENQCQRCGAYRPDGARPILHEDTCPDFGWWRW